MDTLNEDKILFQLIPTYTQMKLYCKKNKSVCRMIISEVTKDEQDSDNESTISDE